MFAVLCAALAVACSSRAPAPAVKVQAAPAATPDSDGTDCKGFGGLIHGDSACMTVDRATLAVTPRTTRVRGDAEVEPSPHQQFAGCDAVETLPSVKFKIHCEALPSKPPIMHQRVSVEILDDAGHATSRGKLVVVDEHSSFWDFMNVRAEEHGGQLELTIDYGVLD